MLVLVLPQKYKTVKVPQRYKLEKKNKGNYTGLPCIPDEKTGQANHRGPIPAA